MVMSAAKTVGAYLASLPDEKRAAITTIRELARRNLPDGYVEGMGFGMINYSIPLTPTRTRTTGRHSATLPSLRRRMSTRST